jgi:hypothetical protein
MIVAAFSTNSAGISQTIAGVLCQVFPLVLGFVIARHTALRLLPRCFTFGEAAFIAQGVSSVGICGMAATVRTWQVARSRWTFGLEWSHQNSVLTILVAINVAMWLTAGSIVMLLLLTRRVASKTPAVTKAVIVYGWAILLLTSVFEPWISRLLGQNAAIWLLENIISDRTANYLCVYWMVNLATIPLVQKMQTHLQLEKIVIRKFFHALVVTMFLPAILVRPDFVGLSFTIATNIFVLVEILRVDSVIPFGSPIFNKFIDHFADDRDKGPIVLSHTYLMVGCGIPLWAATVARLLPRSAQGSPCGAIQYLPQVRKTPSWPRSWANFSLLQLYSHRNAWANLHSLCQPNTFLAARSAECWH